MGAENSAAGHSQLKMIALYGIISSLLFLVTAVLYCHDFSNLVGEWILDDKVSVLQNPLVTGDLPLREIWYRDFWGKDEIAESKSHKSWRPLCTLTYRLNNFFAGGNDPFSFHVTDRLLHSIVTVLTLPVSTYVFFDLTTEANVESLSSFWLFIVPTIASAFFASHPIHVESVANTTGRAEVLCAFFYFIGFLSYARIAVGVKLAPAIKIKRKRYFNSMAKSLLGTFTMLLSSVASMLCKEHGVTLPIICLVWDAYIGTNTSVPEVLLACKDWYKSKSTNHKKPSEESKSNQRIHISAVLDLKKTRFHECRLFVLRICVTIICTVLVAQWRLHKNGDDQPDFVCEQNPGACEKEALVRFFHFGFLWCFNFWLMAWPVRLSPDWTGPSIPILRSIYDPRMTCLVLLWMSVLYFLYNIIITAFNIPITWNKTEKTNQVWKRAVITSAFWMFIPFLMSSNLFVYVGFTIADRMLYLPSFGFCLLQVICLVVLCKSLERYIPINFKYSTVGLAVVILAFYVDKQQSQTKLWSKGSLIWCEGHRVNPGSIVAERECGLALINEEKSNLAAPILISSQARAFGYSLGSKTIEEVRFEQLGTPLSTLQKKSRDWIYIKGLMQTQFILSHALAYAGKCNEALVHIDQGLSRINDVLAEMTAYAKETGVDPTSRTRTYSISEIQYGMTIEKAALLVTKSKCMENLQQMIGVSIEAMKTRPDNPNVVDHVNKVQNIYAEAQKNRIPPEVIKIKWVKVGDTYDMTFGF